MKIMIKDTKDDVVGYIKLDTSRDLKYREITELDNLPQDGFLVSIDDEYFYITNMKKNTEQIIKSKCMRTSLNEYTSAELLEELAKRLEKSNEV